MKTLLLAGLLCCCLQHAAPVFGATYYLSASGNDNNAGTSLAAAWRTIQKLNTIQLQPGDSVLLEGGAVFTGTVYLDADDAGTALLPVYAGSYGSGRAIIQAGNGFGIRAYNCAGIHISGLIIQGSGAQTNTGRGIELYTDLGYDLTHIRIDSCDISGFGDYGIQIGAWNTSNGFNDVRVRYVNSFDNGNGGMMSYGFNTVINHKNFYVGYSTFHDNKGRPDITNTNTGNGIVLSGIDGAVIEYCEAYNNGENNSNPSGGPVGIWFYLVKNGLIQFCESHHNRTGTADGGGFDLDGGAQNCIIQYCYSHDNAGPGYLLAEYGSGLPFTGNTIRYNISQNDARRSSAGAITFWGADAINSIRQSMVYNNTVFVNDANVISGTPSAVKLIGNNFSGVKLSNNIFYTTGTVNMLHADAVTDSLRVHFLANDYYTAGANPVFNWLGTPYSGLAAWKTVAPTQERRGAVHFGLSADPLLNGAGTGGTIGSGQLHQMHWLLTAYKVGLNSPVVDAGIDMDAAFGAVIGNRDFFGNAPSHGAFQDVGAHECNDCYSILSPYDVRLSARSVQDDILIAWTIKNESAVSGFQVEHSRDGRNFDLLHTVKPDGRPNAYSITDTATLNGEKYYRLRILHQNGLHFYSNIVRLTGDGVELALHLSDNKVVIQSPVAQRVQFFLFTMQGQLLTREVHMVPQGRSYHSPAFRRAKGWYLLKVTAGSGEHRAIRIPAE